jgi:hypothetical protein
MKEMRIERRGEERKEKGWGVSWNSIYDHHIIRRKK